MKLMLAILLLMVSSRVAYSQVLSQEQVIRRIIDSGISEGHDQKIVGGMGDAAAVMVTKLLAGRNLTSNEMDSILLVLTSAFADPSMIQTVSDREPRTTLFVLQCLGTSTGDSQLKTRITKTRSYVLERYEKYLKNSSETQ